MDLPPSLLRPLQEIFACGIVGFTISTTVYGITLLQTYLYFRRYPQDRIILKAFVAVLCVLDTLTTVLSSHAMYTFFVLNLRNLSEDVQLPWSFILENGVTDLITALAQCYFAERIYKLSYGNKYLSGSIVLLALVAFGLGIEGTIQVFKDHDLISQSFQRSLALGGAVQGVAVLCDILITGGLCYYFSTSRTGRRSTDTLVDTLMIYAIERGALTGTVQALYLIMSVAFSTRYFFVPFALIVGKLYVNMTLASLNVRDALDRNAWGDCNRTSLQFRNNLTRTWNTQDSTQAVATAPSGASGSTTQIALRTLSESDEGIRKKDSTVVLTPGE